MSFRISFWPFRNHILQSTVNQLSEEDASERLRSSQSRELRPIVDVASHSLATSVLVSGFPPPHEHEESEVEYQAVRMLISLFAGPQLNGQSDFLYFDLIDHFADQLPVVSRRLENGQPWFGKQCPSEKTYGTIGQAEIRELLSSKASALDSSVSTLFRNALDREVDLWFSI